VVATAGGPVPPRGDDAAPAPAPPDIGRPIDGVTAHLCDDALRPVPFGAIGELCVGGVGVARGYLGRPRETAAAFLPDPRSERPGARLYRTGDLARWRNDGTLAFVGRKDDQVQVRGQRVEPGEVESRLAALPGVHAAAVLARTGAAGDVRLVAFVVADDAELGTLEARLRAELPAACVPSIWVALAELPRNAAGKLDRAALRALEPAPCAAAPAPPLTATEHAVAALWADVLERPEVPCETSFFDLGGHSLALLRVAAGLRTTLGVDLPVAELFTYPTVRALAARVDALTIGEGECAPAPPPDRTGRGRERADLRRERRAARRRRSEA
jgi:acyl carrier protein